MILDGEQVVEGVSKGFVKYPGEEHSAWLLRLSHLHCQNQVRSWLLRSVSTISWCHIRASPRSQT